uniref:Uncharacterized protein n=1 Tax=Anguilla anguilla TaxID=7936 RepID=A0A0E9U9X7_ANGAN
MLESKKERYVRQSTMRQFPYSFLIIFRRRRQSMLKTFMLLVIRNAHWDMC